VDDRSADDRPSPLAPMAGTEVNARRQSPVAEFFTGVDGRPPDEGLVLLTEVFHLAEEK
jgi:L-rhamnose mutarotase